jgi:DNA polymerase elongation subunit (family B)
MKTHNFIISNMDTDSISFCKPDQTPFTEEEQEELLKELNSYFPEKIKWEHDGVYQKVIILKAKNYILYKNGKASLKGSSLKSSKTEKALKEFMSEIINSLLQDQNNLVDIYHKYIIQALNVKDINQWASKKTVTESVLNPERTTEQKILDALKGRHIQMGDKYYMYFTNDDKLKVVDEWSGDHNTKKLIQRIYNTLNIFKNVIDITQFKKYHLKNKKIQEELYQLKIKGIINE